MVSIPRMRKAVKNKAFLRRVFTENERLYCDSRPDPAMSYAGVFCAKEAAVKAFKGGFGNGIMPIDVEIVHTESGAPKVVLHGNAAQYSDGIFEVSISHDGDYAVAVVSVQTADDSDS